MQIRYKVRLSDDELLWVIQALQEFNTFEENARTPYFPIKDLINRLDNGDNKTVRIDNDDIQ